MQLSEFASAVTTVALSTHGSITSWTRSEQHNRDVGGVENSLHLVGLAVDMTFPDRHQKIRAQQLADRLGLWVLDEGDHLHLQPLDATPRQ